MRTVAGILVMLMACTSGCGLVNFSGSGSGSDLIFGKSWAPSYYVDEPLYLGNPKYSSRQLLRDFDAKALPSTLGLSATWLDPAGSFYLGYSAIYADGTGWSSPGPNFGIAAQLAGGGAGTDLGYTSLAPVSTGFEGVFFEGSGAGTVNVITDSDLANAYDSTAVKTDSGLGASVPYSGIIDLLAGTPTVTVSDANALNYTYANVGVAGYATWSATQVAAGASGASSGALATTSSLSAHFDGKEYVCGIYELNGGTLAASCVDSKTPTTTAIEVQLDTSVSAHSSTTDGLGDILIVYSKTDTTLHQHIYYTAGVYTKQSAGLTWTTPARLDTGLSLVAESEVVAGARPAVAYLGSGKFIAAWTALNTSALTSAVYYSVYSTGAWSTPSVITGTADTYLITPHPQALTLFSNGAGEAGFALNEILNTTAHPEASNVRQTLVARYNSTEGWTTPVATGGGCTPTILAGCTHPPIGVIFASGNAVVLYQDQDHDLNYRLAGIEFK